MWRMYVCIRMRPSNASHLATVRHGSPYYVNVAVNAVIVSYSVSSRNYHRPWYYPLPLAALSPRLREYKIRPWKNVKPLIFRGGHISFWERKVHGRIIEGSPRDKPRLCISMESCLTTMAATSPSKVRPFLFFYDLCIYPKTIGTTVDIQYPHPYPE